MMLDCYVEVERCIEVEVVDRADWLRVTEGFQGRQRVEAGFEWAGGVSGLMVDVAEGDVRPVLGYRFSTEVVEGLSVQGLVGVGYQFGHDSRMVVPVNVGLSYRQDGFSCGARVGLRSAGVSCRALLP